MNCKICNMQLESIFSRVVAFRKAVLNEVQMVSSLLAASVLGHSLGTLRDSMLGQFSW